MINWPETNGRVHQWAICDWNEVGRSMARKGRSLGNAAMGGGFGRPENELFGRRDCANVTMKELIGLPDGHLCYYNESRLKESFGGMNPVQYRRSLGWQPRDTESVRIPLSCTVSFRGYLKQSS